MGVEDLAITRPLGELTLNEKFASYASYANGSANPVIKSAEFALLVSATLSSLAHMHEIFNPSIENQYRANKQRRRKERRSLRNGTSFQISLYNIDNDACLCTPQIQDKLRSESYTPRTWRTHPLHICPPEPYSPEDPLTKDTLNWIFLFFSLIFSFW